MPKPIAKFLLQLRAQITKATDYGDGKGGAFDFSQQAMLLSITLQAAVPLWSAQLIELEKVSSESFARTLKRWAEEAG